MEETKYLLVGGGLTALNAVAGIRDNDPTGRIILISEEHEPPYDRVPLSKGYLLGKVRKESLFPKKGAYFAEKRVELRTGLRVIGIDMSARAAETEGGGSIAFERLLLATGGRPRSLAIPGSDLEGVSYLRTIGDSDALKARLASRGRVVIIGGGFIGCEIAAAAAAMGQETTIVEALPRILSLAFDPETSSWIHGRLEESGIKVLTDSPAEEFFGNGGKVEGVRTKGGQSIKGDTLLVAIGLRPATELAEDAGLRVENGIVVDQFLETSAAGVFAAGDVANFYHPLYGRRMRLEHYDVAVKEGRVAGANMAGGRVEVTEPPYFFSFLPGMTLNAYGDIGAYEQTLRRGELRERGFFRFFFTGGKLKGFLSVNRPYSEIKSARGLLSQGLDYDSGVGLEDATKPVDTFLVR